MSIYCAYLTLTFNLKDKTDDSAWGEFSPLLHFYFFT